MNRNLSRFDKIMSAITFAEVGELDCNQELAGKEKQNKDKRSQTQVMSSGKSAQNQVAA